MFETFTDRAKKVFDLASQEAQRKNHEYIGTGHVLLGLIKEDNGVGAFVLKDFGLTYEGLKSEIDLMIAGGPEGVIISNRPQTPRFKQVIETAINYANELGDKHVGTEHLLYGLVSVEEGVGAQILKKHNLTQDKLTCVIEDTLDLTSVDKNLRTLMKDLGYTFERRCVKKNGLQVGSFERVNKLSTPVINYDIQTFSDEQINAALTYRDALKTNNIGYKESVSTSELAKMAREKSKNLISLADSLEKRV